MRIRNLAYIVVSSARLPEWERFGREPMGAMSCTDEQGNVLIRLDEYRYRILVVPGSEEKLLAAGWATFNRGDFLAERERVVAEGVEVHDGTPEECRTRYLAGFFWCTDPAGNRHEVVWGRTLEATPFVSPQGIPHFVTGELGFGHVVLPCGAAYDASLDFYERVMQFELSDFFRMPDSFGGSDGMGGRRVHFFHPQNARQHSVAIGEVEVPEGIIHFDVEVPTIDDLGRAMDAARRTGTITRSLGRHVNDANVSFYLRTPGGFMLEYGYDAKLMTWTGHEVIDIPTGSFWGHEWLKS